MGIMPIKPKRRILFHTKDLVAERDTLRTRCERLEKEKAEWERLAKKNAYENGYNSAKIHDLEQLVEKARLDLAGFKAHHKHLWIQYFWMTEEALAKVDKPTPDDWFKMNHHERGEILDKPTTCGTCLVTKDDDNAYCKIHDKPTCATCGDEGEIPIYEYQGKPRPDSVKFPCPDCTCPKCVDHPKRAGKRGTKEYGWPCPACSCECGGSGLKMITRQEGFKTMNVPTVCDCQGGE